MTWLSDGVVARLRSIADWPTPSDARYDILEPIARGGMGTIYLAHDRVLDRSVVFKVLATPSSPSNEDALASRLELEARILARLNHPGIVPVYDLGVLDDGRPYYVMKRVEGPTLAQHALTVRSLTERLRLFLRICEPVAFAHARGVIHRDLKPENIMVGPFGEVLVMDWGIAKLVAPHGDETTESDGTDSGRISASRKTRHGTVLGTRGYMAPEQARGEARIDARADIHALGAILSFLLGNVPTPESGPLSSVRPLEAIARKACSSEPVERYQDVALLMADVGRFLAGDPVSAYQERPIERLGRFARKHRTALLLVLAYLIMRVLIALAP